MKPIYFSPLVLALFIAGCSRKDDAVSPPPAATNTPAAQAQVNQSAQKISSAISDAIATNSAKASVVNTVASVTNAAAAMTTPTPVAAPAIPTISAPPAAFVPPPPTAPATPSVSTSSLASLATDTATQGLKEALGKGLQHAVASLGQPGGFLTNLNVKISLPDKLQPVETALRAIGQGNLVDNCITTMNQAAEQAVPTAADVFVSSLKGMSVDDAKGILAGPNDAATQFFRKSTQADLTAKFTPIVEQAMTKCGATAAYEQALAKARSASPFFSNPSIDLNAYVTQKAMDGLFKMVADEEKSIRENPAARSTDLLKSVFGALQK